MANSVVCAGCTLGDRVWLNPSAIVGGEGFGFAPTLSGHLKIPQVGRAVVEDDVEIGSNSCVDRGAMDDTVVGRGTKVDNLVQLGHGAEVGEECLLVAYAGIAGSARLGKRVVLAAKSGVIGHLEIGDGCQAAVHSIVMSDQPPGAQLAGTPAFDRRDWLRAVTAFKDLPRLLRRVRDLEARVAELEARDDAPAGVS
jgi:UDP-3-O-[3-hydroxymyristoyl] glucosamine N-acyltransferase